MTAWKKKPNSKKPQGTQWLCELHELSGAATRLEELAKEGWFIFSVTPIFVPRDYLEPGESSAQTQIVAVKRTYGVVTEDSTL